MTLAGGVARRAWRRGCWPASAAAITGLGVTLLATRAAAAEAPSAPTSREPAGSRDAFDLEARSETYLQLFERALLPGPGGSLIDPTPLAPVHEYLTLRGHRLNAPWAVDAIDFELQAWGAATLVGDSLTRDPDGDVPVANVTARFGPTRLRLGRQVQTRGAARFARFDGAEIGVRADSGFSAVGYGGLTVRPRWSARPAYYQLGSTLDTLLESPDALPDPGRSGDFLGGAALGYAHPSLGSVGVAFHEQHLASGLERRELAADLQVVPTTAVEVTAQGFVDPDRAALTEGSAAVDVYPMRRLAVMGELRHLTPSLLLGRQSVLAVFQTGAFDEIGAEVRYQVSSRLRLRAAQYAALLGLGDIGARTRVGARAQPETTDRLTLDVEYGRVVEPENGYHSTRLAVRYALLAPIVVTGEHDAYFYDRAIASVAFSSVEALTVEVAPTPPLRVLFGATYSQTPYAVSAVAGLMRVAYWLDRVEAP